MTTEIRGVGSMQEQGGGKQFENRLVDAGTLSAAEERYKGQKLIYEEAKKKFDTAEQQYRALQRGYREQAVVDGMKVTVLWNDHGFYEIIIPQKVAEAGGHSADIGVSNDPRVAKKVFDYTVSLLRSEGDYAQVYEKVNDYIVKTRSEERNPDDE